MPEVTVVRMQMSDLSGRERLLLAEQLIESVEASLPRDFASASFAGKLRHTRSTLVECIPLLPRNL